MTWRWSRTALGKVGARVVERERRGRVEEEVEVEVEVEVVGRGRAGEEDGEVARRGEVAALVRTVERHGVKIGWCIWLRC